MQNWPMSLMLSAALLVAWIEFFDKRFKSFAAEWLLVSLAVVAMVWLPYWLVLIALLVAAADIFRAQRNLDKEAFWREFHRNAEVFFDALGAFLWAAACYVGRLLRAGMRWTSSALGEWRRQALAAEKKRWWPSALGLVLVSPVAAIPAALALATLFLVGAVVDGFESGTMPGVGKLFGGWLAVATYIILIGLDQLIDRFLVAGPVLVLISFLGAVFATRPGIYWRRFVLASMAVGAFYPATFAIVELFGLHTQSYWN